MHSSRKRRKREKSSSAELSRPSASSPAPIPVFHDWCDRRYDVFPPYTIQQTDGFCWAIVVAETVAAAHKAKDLSRPRRDLSIQELMDFCLPNKKTVYAYGLRSAFEWVKHNGLRSKAEYPLAGIKQEGIQKTDIEKNNATYVRGYIWCQHPRLVDEKEMLKVVTSQPIAAIIPITRGFGQFRGNGIYERPKRRKREVQEEESKKVEYHAISLVGFGSLGGKNYWSFRNSWGLSWGSGGNGKILRLSSVKDPKDFLIEEVAYLIV